MDSIRAISGGKGQNEDSEQVETKKSKRQHHRKHSRKESHRHKSRRKDKKHSSSKHKHKRKSSSQRSREHKRKDHRIEGSKEDSEKLVKMGRDSDDKRDLTVGDNVKNEDSESSTSIDTTDENESDFEGRSVSPPMQLGKDDSSEPLPLDTSARELPVRLPKNVVPTEKEEIDINDSSAGGGSGEQKQILEGEQKESAKPKDEASDCKPQLSVEENDENTVEKRDTLLAKMATKEVLEEQIQGTDVKSVKLEEKDKKSRQSTKEDEQLKSSEDLPLKVEKNLPAGHLAVSDLTAKVACNNTEKKNILIPNSEEGKVKEGAQELKKDIEGTQKVQNKQKVIKINIKTLELPTDVSVASTEDKAKGGGGSNTSEDDDDDEDDDNNGNGDGRAKNPSHPWRIVPEEGELTPSSSSNECEGGQKSERGPAAGQKGKDDGGSKEEEEVTLKDEPKHRKRRRHKEKEDGEIKDAKKKRRHKGDRHDKNSSESKDRGNSRKSVKDRLGVRVPSKSPERKLVRSSVVVHNNRSSPKRHSGYSRSRSKTPPQYRSRSRSPYSSRYSSSRGRGNRSRSRSPGDRRSRSPHRRRNHVHRDNRSDRRDRRRDWSRSPSREERKRRERSYTPVEEIDKKKLFEIAKANAYLYQKVMSGDLPANTKFPQLERKAISLAGEFES